MVKTCSTPGRGAKKYLVVVSCDIWGRNDFYWDHCAQAAIEAAAKVA
jgi:hypothetical protein